MTESAAPQLDPLLMVLLGPTASGKTSLSLHMAERFHGEIVSCDSVAVYREFEIGTAKPSLADRKRIPHHLIDVAAPTEQFTAGDYSRLARAVIATFIPGAICRSRRRYRTLSPRAAGRIVRWSRVQTNYASVCAKCGRFVVRVSPSMLRRLDPRLPPPSTRTTLPKLNSRYRSLPERPQSMTQMWQTGRDPLRGFHSAHRAESSSRSALSAHQGCPEMFDEGLLEETKMLMAVTDNRRVLFLLLGHKQAAQVLAGECPASRRPSRHNRATEITPKGR